jgi:hypothetical protein
MWEDVRKGWVRGLNVVKILCTHVLKMRPVETVLKMGKGGIKKNDGVGEFN